MLCEAIPKSRSDRRLHPKREIADGSFSTGKILRKDFKNVKGSFVQLYKPKKRAVRTAKL